MSSQKYSITWIWFPNSQRKELDTVLISLVYLSQGFHSYEARDYEKGRPQKRLYSFSKPLFQYSNKLIHSGRTSWIRQPEAKRKQNILLGIAGGIGVLLFDGIKVFGQGIWQFAGWLKPA